MSEVKKLELLFQTLSETNRLKIINFIRDKGRSVTEIVDKTDKCCEIDRAEIKWDGQHLRFDEHSKACRRIEGRLHSQKNSEKQTAYKKVADEKAQQKQWGEPPK